MFGLCTPALMWTPRFYFKCDFIVISQILVVRCLCTVNPTHCLGTPSNLINLLRKFLEFCPETLSHSLFAYLNDSFIHCPVHIRGKVHLSYNIYLQSTEFQSFNYWTNKRKRERRVTLRRDVLTSEFFACFCQFLHTFLYFWSRCFVRL